MLHDIDPLLAAFLTFHLFLQRHSGFANAEQDGAWNGEANANAQEQERRENKADDADEQGERHERNGQCGFLVK